MAVKSGAVKSGAVKSGTHRHSAAGRTARTSVPALIAALTLSLGLAACTELTGTDPIITSSAGPGTTTSPADPALLPSAVPGETLEQRLARLEFDLAQLKLDYSVVRPSFEQLVEREENLKSRVAAVESALGPFTASIPAATGRTTPAPAPRKTPAPAPARSTKAQPVTTSSVPGEMGLHLASYRSLDRLKEGWAELKAKHPAELTGLNVRIQRINTGSNGVFQRLIAGPVTSHTAADGLCRTLSSKGVYCKPMGFTGDAF